MILANANVDGLIAKATQGVIKDPTFDAKIEDANRFMVPGSYHFADPWVDAIASAQAYIATCKPHGPMMLVLDLEWYKNHWDSLSMADRQKWVKTFLGVLQDAIATGIPFIYTSASFFDYLLAGLDLSAYLLYVADYRKGIPGPAIPTCWAKVNKSWTIWQKTGTDIDPGLIGEADLDLYRGDKTMLSALVCTWR